MQRQQRRSSTAQAQPRREASPARALPPPLPATREGTTGPGRPRGARCSPPASPWMEEVRPRPLRCRQPPRRRPRTRARAVVQTRERLLGLASSPQAAAAAAPMRPRRCPRARRWAARGAAPRRPAAAAAPRPGPLRRLQSQSQVPPARGWGPARAGRRRATPGGPRRACRWARRAARRGAQPLQGHAGAGEPAFDVGGEGSSAQAVTGVLRGPRGLTCARKATPDSSRIPARWSAQRSA